MPLIHSKKPSAFKENVRKEVEAGKPVKQAVAIAYSVKRHSESKGGKIEGEPFEGKVPYEHGGPSDQFKSEGGMAEDCYDEGGPVEAEGNGGTSLAEACADELHAALEKKDHKAIVSAIHNIMNLKEE
jgi:hypothetical protein